MVSAEEQQVLSLQEQIREAEKTAGSSNPASGYDPGFVTGAGKDTYIGKQYSSWVAGKAAATEKLKTLKTQYENLIASNPALGSYAGSHPATTYELQDTAVGMFGGSALNDVQVNHAWVPSTDKTKYLRLQTFARDNPNASIGEVITMYQGDPLPQGNATIDYEATLSARQQGFNVGSGIPVGLAETYQKEWDKQFAAHNKIIGLTENIYTGRATKGQPPPPAIASPTPQNPRTKTERGSLDRLNANPAYAQKGSDRALGIKENAHAEELGTTHYTLSLTEGGGKPEPKHLGISLSEGKPNEPRNLTQEQVNKLSPQEYAIYQAEYAAYNQYVKQKNIEIKKENTLSLKKYQSNVLGIIEKARAEGATRIRITDELGNVISTTPIERAFYDISKQRGKDVFIIAAGEPERHLTGISQGKGEEITQTYTEGERFKTGVFVPVSTVRKTGEVETETPITELSMTRERYAEQQKYQPNDPLSNALRQADVMERSSHRDVKIASSVISNIGSQFAGFVNLSNEGARMFAESVKKKQADFTSALTGKPRIETTRSLVQDVAIPESAPGKFFDTGIYGGAEQTIKTKNPKAFPSRLAEAGTEYYGALQKDPLRTIAETGGFLVPIVPVPTPGIAQAKRFVGKVAGFLKESKPILSFKTIEEPLLQVKLRPTNPMRESGAVIKESVRLDTATPFQKEYVNLGRSHAVVAGERIPARNALGGSLVKETTPKTAEKTKVPTPDAFYKPKVDIRRAPEPNTYRSDDRITFGQDTATSFEKQSVSLGEGRIRQEKIEQARNALGGIVTKASGEIPFASEPIGLGEGTVVSKRQNVPLGAGVGKRITPKFDTQRIELGEGKQVIKRQAVDLGAGTVKRITGRFEQQAEGLGEGKIVYKKQAVSLGTGELKKGVTVEDQIIITKFQPKYHAPVKLVQEDPFYKPYSDVRRAPEIGKFRADERAVFGTGTKSTPSFAESTERLGAGRGRTGTVEKSKGPFAQQEGNIIKYTDELEAQTKALGKKQPKTSRENQYKPITRKDEGLPTGKGTQQILEPRPEPKAIQKLAEAEPEKGGGFTKISVGLGEGKGIAIATGGIAVAPIPLLVRGEDQGTPITNGTQTNGTGTVPIIIEEPQNVSVLEPQSITESRPSTVGAIVSGSAYDLYAGVRPITRTGLGLGTSSVIETRQNERRRQPVILSYAEVTGLRQPQKERQRTAEAFPEPTRQPQRLVQPEAFKEKEKLKLKTPEKITPPERIPQRVIIPFSEKKKKTEKRKKEEQEDVIPFIGNVFEEQVAGGFKEFDVKYGAKKVSRQSALGLSITRRGRKTFVESESRSLLKNKPHQFTEKKPKTVTRSGFAKPGKKFRW